MPTAKKVNKTKAIIEELEKDQNASPTAVARRLRKFQKIIVSAAYVSNVKTKLKNASAKKVAKKGGDGVQTYTPRTLVKAAEFFLVCQQDNVSPDHALSMVNQLACVLGEQP